QTWPSAEARVAIIRGLIEVSGPITEAEVARRLCVTPSQTEVALEALEGEGLVLRGRFTPALNARQSREWREGEGTSVQGPGSGEDVESETVAGPSTPDPQPSTEWCHRRLLARIHRLTLQGLRRQIEPVGVDVFQRFLFQHHGLTAGRKRSGANGLFDVVAMLQGIDIPAVAWERDVLPARVDGYAPTLLDELCLRGEVGWGRFHPAKRDPERGRPMAALTRVAPISLYLREDADWLLQSAIPADLETLSTPARQLYDLLAERGATFASDLLNETQMLPAQLNDALGELVTRGALTADGFGGLRSLIREPGNAKSHRRARSRGLARRRATGGTVGRWSLAGGGEEKPGFDMSKPTKGDAGNAIPGGDPLRSRDSNPIEQWAWQLLRRWGVVFRDLLARETCAPRWWELLQVYRRLEARGEIRGGRFIIGVAGEQFAVGDTIRQLRKLREAPPREDVITLNAADPLNLVGIVTDHPRVPATAANTVAYLNGSPVARRQAGALEFFETLTEPRRAMLARHLDATPAVRRPRNGEPQTAETGTPHPDPARSRQPRYPNGIPRPLY
ncbi:MAG: DEAD/DEAH box helicase, partial [Planctomycetaceae bacterium]